MGAVPPSSSPQVGVPVGGVAFAPPPFQGPKENQHAKTESLQHVAVYISDLLGLPPKSLSMGFCPHAHFTPPPPPQRKAGSLLQFNTCMFS